MADRGITLNIKTGGTMDIAAGIARALKVDEPSHEPTTGSDAQRQFARMKARLVARYRLAAVSGRPEELVRPSTSRGVSLGYGCRTIRVRLMDGREWVDRADFQIKDDWQDRLDAMCDEWFGIEESNLGVPRLKPLPLDEAPAGPVRPIPKDPRRPKTNWRDRDEYGPRYS